MPIELTIEIGIGVLFGGLICVSVLSLIHRRAIRLTERRLESAFEHSTAQARADKELLQTILLHARAQMIELDKKESAINRLSSELDALKIEFVSLKTKFESTYSAPLNEYVSLVPLAPTTSQVTQKNMWLRGCLSLQEGGCSQPDGGKQSPQKDTWVRDEPPKDGGESELQALLQLPGTDLIAQINRQTDQVGRDKVSHLITKTEKDRVSEMQSSAG
jgi:hypothetical protein